MADSSTSGGDRSCKSRLSLNHKGLDSHINIRILHSAAKARDKGDCKYYA